MNIRYFLSVLAFLFIAGASTSCRQMNEAADTQEVQPIRVSIKTISAIREVTSLDGLSVSLEDVKYGIRHEAVIYNNEVVLPEITPGNYNIKITGKVTTSNGKIYQMSIKSAGANNYIFTHAGEVLELKVTGAELSPLIFKEIFFAGTKPFYFRNQYYEIYNNSTDKTIYLDNIYFAHLTPTTARTELPIWPEEDDNNYAYAERIWKFPGKGKDYPLAPGESCVISQFAVNHKLKQYNPDSPVDCSASEFEFFMGNPKFPDQPAVNMRHIFYNGKSVIGSMPQYLVSVFGGAYVIFQPTENEKYDPVNDKAMQAQNLSSTSTQVYAKVPIAYILDAVEGGHNAGMLNAKRVPAVLDQGMTYVGETYNSLSVTRKQIGKHPDGTPLLQDTNNSTEDFIHGIVPEFRRYGAKMPGWNHTIARK